ncbi:MAG: hypothetical protein HQL94_10915 [Magnetococcales bacterium]|nr:hypothetical protein [Magnetococcales bacterium]
MKMLQLDILDAKQGDCFVLQYGTKEAPKYVLFDGGPSGVWRATLKPYLQELQGQHPDPNGLLPIQLLVVTHVDNDHIKGILEMTEEMLSSAPRWLDIKKRWFNGWKDMVRNSTTMNGANMTLASFAQGNSLGVNFAQLGLPDNYTFSGSVMGYKRVILSNGPVFHIIGPTEEQLQKLKKVWKTPGTGVGCPKTAPTAQISCPGSGPHRRTPLMPTPNQYFGTLAGCSA